MESINKFMTKVEERVTDFGRKIGSITFNSKIGFLEALTLLFAAAKLFGFTDWSWLMVFCPIIFKTAAVIALSVVGGILITIVSLVEVITDTIANCFKTAKAAESAKSYGAMANTSSVIIEK